VLQAPLLVALSRLLVAHLLLDQQLLWLILLLRQLLRPPAGQLAPAALLLQSLLLLATVCAAALFAAATTATQAPTAAAVTQLTMAALAHARGPSARVGYAGVEICARYCIEWLHDLLDQLHEQLPVTYDVAGTH
jgi:hypothetical protein